MTERGDSWVWGEKPKRNEPSLPYTNAQQFRLVMEQRGKDHRERLQTEDQTILPSVPSSIRLHTALTYDPIGLPFNPYTIVTPKLVGEVQNKSIDRLLREDDELRPNYTREVVDFQPVLLLTCPESEIESYFWRSIDEYIDPEKIRTGMQDAFAQRIRQGLKLGLQCARKMGLSVPLQATPNPNDFTRLRQWAQAMWTNENVRRGHEMIGGRLTECDHYLFDNANYLLSNQFVPQLRDTQTKELLDFGKIRHVKLQTEKFNYRLFGVNRLQRRRRKILPLLKDHSDVLVFLVAATSLLLVEEGYEYLGPALRTLSPKGMVVILFNSSVLEEAVLSGMADVPPESPFQPAKGAKQTPMKTSIAEIFEQLFRSRCPNAGKFCCGSYESGSGDESLSDLTLRLIRELSMGELLDMI